MNTSTLIGKRGRDTTREWKEGRSDATSTWRALFRNRAENFAKVQFGKTGVLLDHAIWQVLVCFETGATDYLTIFSVKEPADHHDASPGMKTMSTARW
jgi:hypothetical protein